MQFTLSYGNDSICGALDWGRCLGVLDIADTPEIPNRDATIRNAILNPIGLEKNLLQILRPKETVAIVVSDSFRKTCSHHYLPVLIALLNEAKIPDENISFVYATGSHRAPKPEEEAVILGKELYKRFKSRTFAHDPRDESNLVELGVTSRGTRVTMNHRVVEVDRVIVTGAVVLHYFGGFGGGRKAILPGLAGLDAISHNHSMNLDPVSDVLNPDVRIGVMDGNPVAEDMLEGAKFLKVDYLLNTVLNREGKIAGVFAGDFDEAHRAAAAFAYDMFAVHIGEQADFVVAASGPTRNFVQTHKALFNAYQAVKPTGRILLAAKCEEGLGGEQFVKWLRLGSREAIIQGLRKQSEINGQTALSTVQKGPITLMVTDMPESDVNYLCARKTATIDNGIETIRQELLSQGIANPSYYVMPSAAYTVPFTESVVGAETTSR